MSRAELPETAAHIAVFVEALGVDGAISFLLRFGGADLFMPRTITRDSELARAIGFEAAVALWSRRERIPGQIPTAKKWIAQVWAAQGLPQAEIARRLHTTTVTVRKYLRTDAEKSYPKHVDQPDLFDRP